MSKESELPTYKLQNFEGHKGSVRNTAAVEGLWDLKTAIGKN